MRTYDLLPLQVRRAEATARMARLAGAGRRVRHKPRSEEERAVLIRMAAGGMQRRVASGRLIQTGPRSWRMILRQSSIRPATPPVPRPTATTQGADR